MTKWVKFEVPDDFDSDQYDILEISGYGAKVSDTPSYPDSTIMETPHVKFDTKVWEPQYREVLDQGFVGLVDFMGDDEAVVNAARVSYGKGTKKVNTDRGLVRYLMRHRHTTPFEMCEFKFHVKAPIFVFRQWHRHRTASINEYSGRYSEMTDDMYVPEWIDAKPQSTTNRQGRSESTLSDNDYAALKAALDESYGDSFATYKYLLGGGTPPDKINNRRLFVEESAVKAIQKARDEHPDVKWTEEMMEEKIQEWYRANELAVFDEDYPGLARELARIVLPLATYSQMYWKTNLHNLMHFIGLRSDPHAQKEIRVYSDAMLELIKPFMPWAVEAFIDYQMEGTNVSRYEVETLRALIANLRSLTEVSSVSSFGRSGELDDAISRIMKVKGASDREIREFLVRFAE